MTFINKYPQRNLISFLSSQITSIIEKPAFGFLIILNIGLPIPEYIRKFGVFKIDWVKRELKNTNILAKIRGLWTIAYTHVLVE